MKILNAPSSYRELIAPIPKDVDTSERFRKSIDLIHLFTAKRDELIKQVSIGLKQIKPGGMIWVSWPKNLRPFHQVTVNDQCLTSGTFRVKV